MKWIVSFLFVSIINLHCIGQTENTSQSILRYLDEVKRATTRHVQLWGINLYGPILFVDPATRKMYCNEQDSLTTLRNESGIFTGTLPTEINIANTSIRWNGKLWAMVMLPIPENKEERINLITHELFHRAQSALTFKNVNADNNHLDKRDGRIYLRLELEALQRSIESASKDKAREHLYNALLFREQRHRLFPGADSTENLLELNEGLAEYTGLMMSGRNGKEVTRHLSKSIKEFQKTKTFVRSFAYQTIPTYGYLATILENKRWNRNINMKTDLTAYFFRLFKINVPSHVERQTLGVFEEYNGVRIMNEEERREEENLKLVRDLIQKFVTDPHMDVGFENMNISFDPRNLIPVENYGTVYPNMRVADNWGTLTVDDGALLSPNWNKVTLTAPSEIGDNVIKGEGWTLELKDGYVITKEGDSSIYMLKKE